ncbi:hypothetical protein L3X38_040757 [Prunus dulcis]|uniref:Non-ATPase subunit 9 n=1 Tax=Prunus dulcis TaxID=3755 RepID=A0AAD4UT18_PRUDU|nr:hypothetical protein L3X38_040757 [Prunus dulcis]
MLRNNVLSYTLHIGIGCCDGSVTSKLAGANHIRAWRSDSLSCSRIVMNCGSMGSHCTSLWVGMQVINIGGYEGWAEGLGGFHNNLDIHSAFVTHATSCWCPAASMRVEARLASLLMESKEFDFSEQWFLFFPYLIKYKEKENRVVLSVKMVSQQQTKDSGSKKLGIVAPQDKSSKEMKSSKKMKFASSSAETESQTTISDDSKTGRGMSTMPRVVKKKLQKVRPIVEYNKMGKGIGQAHIEMQLYIGVLARSRVPLVDKKWSQIPKDVKEQIWEAVDMAFVVGQGGKKSVLASAAKKWKDFKSTLTRHYILPYTNDKEKLSHPPETYKFIEKAQWDAFVASRLSQDFESVHSQHAQIREKLEYNHRLSRKGYAGLEDELEETMPGVEIDRSTLWKRARQDKHGLGRHAVHPSRKLAKSGDYDQPVPPADSSVTPSQLESLWQDAGDRSQPDPQSWQVSGTQSQPSRNPGRSRGHRVSRAAILAGLGRHAVHPSRKLAKSGDYDQPVPPADSSVTPSQLESLWQDAGDRSQPDPQSWQVSGTQSQPSRNPGRSRGHRVSRAAILAGLGTPSLPSRKSWHSRFERPRNS